MDTIFIRGLEVSAIIGANNWERQVKQTLVFDVEMAADVSKAASTDNLEDALSYSAVAAVSRISLAVASFSWLKRSLCGSPILSWRSLA